MNWRSIQNRLGLLQVVFVAAIVGGLVALNRWQMTQAEMMFEERITQTERFFDRLVSLRARSFALHVEDYSLWDEFVAVIRKPDPEWMRVYLDEGTVSFGVDAVWALDAQGRALFAARHDGGRALERPPVAPDALLAALRTRPYLHFFERVDGSVLELWTAPVQPARDSERRSPPAGYYVVGRFLTPSVLDELSKQADGVASLSAAKARVRSASGSAKDGTIDLQRRLAGLDGRSVATLGMRVDYPLMAQLIANGHTLMLTVALSAALIMVIGYTLLTFWLARPLDRIRSSLEAESPALLGRMQHQSDELGSIARLVADFFRQREALVGEVETRQATERALALREAHMRTVIDADPNVIYVVDHRHRLVLANRSAQRLFATVAGPAADTDHMERLLDALGCGDTFRRSEGIVLSSGEPREIAETARMADGTVRYYRSIRCPLARSEDDVQVLTVSVDVTHHVEQEAQLREARDAAEAGARAKSQFLANISHELRTPMHGILSYAKFGLREAGSAEPDQIRDYFQNIRDCGQGLLELLNDLLDLAKFESGRMRFDFADLELSDPVDSAVNEFESLLHERGIRIEVESGADLPHVVGDRTRLVQVLRNLLSNAARFTPGGRSIRVSTAFDERHVRIRVEDEGPGIPEGELEAIFDRFVQSSETRSGSGGTGLGLAISREIIAAHGGRIWAENRSNGGSRLCIELPRADAPNVAVVKGSLRTSGDVPRAA